MEDYPEKLQQIITLFENLPEQERREVLISYADQAASFEPAEGETFVLEDVRKDEECTDEVGVFLNVKESGGAVFRMKLGSQVQTLTKAMTSILCRGLEGCSPEMIYALPSEFVPRIIGQELVRARSQTVYYILTRIKSICKVYLDRLRAASAEAAS